MNSRNLDIMIDAQPLTLHEFARAVGADEAWVMALVEVEILPSGDPPAEPANWLFRSADLRLALAARRLERDFGTNLEAAALILGLQAEMRRLQARLAAHGLA